VGDLPGAYENAFFGNNMEEDGGVSSDEDEVAAPPEEGEVVIKFSRALKQKIRAPWSTSLIVKVFGRSIGYVFLVNKLNYMWKTYGNFSCVDLGEGFFLIRFESRNSFEEVLKGGPWFIGEHFLSLRPWSPNFRASEASVSSIAVWVRLPELPVEYYHKEALMLIGSGLGPVLRVDVNTATGNRGRFARICIQIDIKKPLARTVRVGKAKVAVIYEGIGLLCFFCGKVGHRKEWCPCKITATPGNKQPEDRNTSCTEEVDKHKGFGPWMLVSRRKRQGTPAVVSNPGTTSSSPNANSVDSGRGGFQDKTQNSSNRFKYSSLDKGKKAQNDGLRTKGLAENLEPNSLSETLEPKSSEQAVGFSTEHGPITNKTSLQSSPFNVRSPLEKISSSSKLYQPPFAPNSTVISLSPQTPISTFNPNTTLHPLGHDKHALGSFSNIQETVELEDSPEGTEYSDHRGHNRAHSKGTASYVGLVRRRDGSSLGRNSFGSPSNRFSRSPSPNRYGVVARDKSFLEFSHGCSEDRRDKLSSTYSLSAIAGAEISAISGGGLLCNTSRVRREEGDAVKPNSAQLEGTSEFTKISSACEMHSSIQDRDKLLRNEGRGDTNLSVCYGRDSEHYLGALAGEGMECTRGGEHAVPDSKSSVYVVQ
jgi:hypothetical protein